MSQQEKYQKLVEGFTLILEGIGADLDDPHFKDTPERAARAWWNELCAGLTKPPPKVTVFPIKGEPQMVMLRNIPIQSMCAHHLLPFFGKAHIAYIPGRGEIMGLSKLSRIANYYARRPQVQETLTSEIAEHIWDLIKGDSDSHGQGTGGVGVMIRANHMCMCARGVNHDGDMVTNVLRGYFRSNPEVRAEFLQLAMSDDAKR